MQSTVVFRRAQEEDAAVIAKLRQEIWSTTYRGIYPDHMIDQFDYAWHTKKDAQRIKSPAYAVYLMIQEDHLIGYITLHISAPAHLLSLYLRQEYQHRGIGCCAFAFIREVFQTLGVSTFTCECQPDNEQAMAFYRRCGGHVVGEDLNNEESWQNSVTFQFDVKRKTGPVIRAIRTMDECIEFVRSFHGDAQFSDPMLTNEEQFQTNLVRCVEHPDQHRALGVYLGEKLIGLFTFLVLPEERYLEMLVGLSRDCRAYAEMFCYLERHYPGYSADFVFNPQNHLWKQLLEERNAEFEPEQQKMVLVVPVTDIDTSGVELFTPEYQESYLSMHHQETYWTGEKVLAAADRFRVFLAIHEGKVVGYLDVTYCYEQNEPYDLFVLEAYREMGFGRKLLAQALKCNGPKGMMAMVDVEAVAAIRLFESVGFQRTEQENNVTAHWTVPDVPKSLYHVSAISGLTELIPSVSSHGKPYVYAVADLTTGLLFGAKHDDFDFILDTSTDGITEIYECYPGAFQRTYQGKNCSVYEVSGEGFLAGQTPWDAEMVCVDTVPIQREMVVPDLYHRLLQEERNGTLIVHRYVQSTEYKQTISQHIVDRLIRFDALNQMGEDLRFQRYYSRIIEALRSAMDGHLL